MLGVWRLCHSNLLPKDKFPIFFDSTLISENQCLWWTSVTIVFPNTFIVRIRTEDMSLGSTCGTLPIKTFWKNLLLAGLLSTSRVSDGIYFQFCCEMATSNSLTPTLFGISLRLDNTIELCDRQCDYSKKWSAIPLPQFNLDKGHNTQILTDYALPFNYCYFLVQFNLENFVAK